MAVRQNMVRKAGDFAESYYTPSLEEAQNAYRGNERVVKAKKNKHTWRLVQPIPSPTGLSENRLGPNSVHEQPEHEH